MVPRAEVGGPHTPDWGLRSAHDTVEAAASIDLWEEPVYTAAEGDTGSAMVVVVEERPERHVQGGGKAELDSDTPP